MQRLPLPASDAIRALPPDGGAEFNRLIHETSPYLLQHARNPVDWFPWGAEAKGRAKAEDKPIFLSIGYSSCHWCHVMEHESFENEDIAAVLNRHFVPVKVDREERPDIDDLYMIVTQLMTGRGGWPNSVWLLPDGRPWYAGTYFPPDDRGGRLGFKNLLLRLAEIWQTRRSDVEEQARQLADAIRAHAAGSEKPATTPRLEQQLEQAFETWRQSYDLRHGGFGAAPKFPPHSALELILHHASTHRDPTLQSLATGTLDAMALGGIHDHIGGGFHRYSTDERWLLPHFEKMLYDNAQLAHAYTEAYRVTGVSAYKEIACDILDWALREMNGPEGGFYSALDADSNGEEGRFYVWSRQEILDALGADAGALFCRLYQIEERGNFFDEATGRPTGLNIPHLETWLAPDCSEQMSRCRTRLREQRDKRVWPGLDNKRLTSWNGLMIGALARAGQVFNERTYINASAQAANFLLSASMPNGELMRVWRADQARVPAFLEDYAALATGLLALHEADNEPSWLDRAERLGRQMMERFVDPATGHFLPTSDRHENLLARMPDYFDQTIPSATSLAIKSLATLAQRGRDAVFKTIAGRAFAAALPLAARYPSGCAALLHAGVLLGPEELKGRVEVELRAMPLRTAPGDTIRVDAKFEIPSGWKLQTSPSGQRFLVTVGGDCTLVEIAGDFFTMRLRPDIATSTATADIQLTFSVCADTACLPPETIARRLSFAVNLAGEQ